LVLGSVLLWRALSVAALTHSADLVDPRYLVEWSSPGLNRSVKLAFESYRSEPHDSGQASIDVADAGPDHGKNRPGYAAW
jgi:hypothetical protein